jgi:hypothetical protein
MCKLKSAIILWMAKTAADIASIIGFIIGLCSLDSEALLLPAVGLLTSTAWIGFRLWKLEESNIEDEEGADDERSE